MGTQPTLRPTASTQARVGLKMVRETMGVWFGRILVSGFGAKSVDSKSRDQNRMQGSL